MIELRQLRYFKVLAEELHFGRAAARLSIVQPALSRQIQQMEHELGVSLLHRTQRRVELLPAGALLLERATMILEAFGRALEDTRRTGTGTLGRLRIGFINSSTYGVLPSIISRFRELYPGIELELEEMPVATQHEALLRGTIDIGLLRAQSAPAALEVVPFMEDPFMLALPSRHPAAGASRVALKSLRDEPFVMFGRGFSSLLQDRVMSMCERAGFAPRVVQEATQIHTVVGLVGAGIGIAVVPEVARNLQNQHVRFVRLSDQSEPLYVALAWQRAHETPAIQSFRKVTAMVVREMALDKRVRAVKEK